jgi:hypothetical protein
MALPARCVTALRELRDRQDREHEKTGDRWQDDVGLVFTTRYGGPVDAASVRRDLDGHQVRRGHRGGPVDSAELGHRFVSLLSDNKVPLERISMLVGPKSTLLTELVYRQQIRLVLRSWTASSVTAPSDSQSLT